MCSTGSNANDCPLTGNLKTSVDYKIISENFCATIEIDVVLIAKIKVYEDKAFTLIRTAFIVGASAFFKVELDSELNGNPNTNRADDIIKFDWTKITEVHFIVKDSNGKQQTALTLYKNAVTSVSVQAAINFEIIKVDSAAHEFAGFSFVISRKLIDLAAEAVAGKGLPANSKFTFTVNVVSQVGYTDTSSGSGRRKRLIEGIQFALAEAGSDKSSVGDSTPIDITDADLSTTATTTGSTSGTATSASATSAGATSAKSTSSSATQLIMGLVTLMCALLF
jgi:hypothetical protein